MNMFSHVPPGFRFHPTDEELVDYYLRKKISAKKIDLDVIRDVDLYRIEPWDLLELCRIGSEEQSEWFFFSHKDRKYPTGTRTNRATKAGFWKATGRDKGIYTRHTLIGMRKTLVFYKGRAPNGQKSDWIMHEYRLETIESGTSQEEGWVVCKVFKKRMPTISRRFDDYGMPFSYDHSHDHISNLIPELDHHHHHSSARISHPFNNTSILNQNHSCKQELQLQYDYHAVPLGDSSFPNDLPHLEIPKLAHESVHHHQVTDWQAMDKYVASQLSNNIDQSNDHEDIMTKMLENHESSKTQEIGREFDLLTSTSSSQIDLIWN